MLARKSQFINQEGEKEEEEEFEFHQILPPADRKERNFTFARLSSALF